MSNIICRDCDLYVIEIERLRRELAEAQDDAAFVRETLGESAAECILLRGQLAEAKGLLEEAVGDVGAYETELSITAEEHPDNEGMQELVERVGDLVNRMTAFLKRSATP